MEFEVSEFSYFQKNIEKKVKRINLMSGNEYEEPINTPACCSPACETYWTM